jgi:CheY-like chemotaxis protein
MDPGIMKALSRETKALILVSEFEARRMPMFQLRSVLEAIVRDEEERKIIIDLVENDLRATGHSPEQISTFLSDLCTAPIQKPPAIDSQILATRKLRSPFAMGFDAGTSSAPPPADPPRSATFGPGAFRPQSNTALPPGVAAPSPRPAASFMTPQPPSDAPPPPPDNLAPPSRQTPAGGVALPPPPKPPVRGGATVRRSTFVFDPVSPAGSGPKPAVTSTPPGGSPSSAGLAPVGDKTTARHNLMFAGIGTAPAASASGEAPAANSTRKGTILLADDDKRARMVFRLRLEEAGFTTIEVGTGTEAWERIQQGGLAAAVLDMKMPGLHGLEVLSHIADKQLGLPVVICTAYDQLEDEFIVQTYPKLKYLVKPIAPETLVNSIKELLAVK